MKVVVNKCYGGFSVSAAAVRFMRERGNADAIAEVLFGESTPEYTLGYDYQIYGREFSRHDPDLVAAVETLGSKANGACADLEVVEIPDGAEYEIDEYDGMERVCAPRIWYG